ncbi:putative transcriptional regulator [Pseudomonas aeruginosa]|nr:putative transcriptional regulator [Pseudomonas aeruginosa]
MAQGHDSPTL